MIPGPLLVMGELTTADVTAFTKGRLTGGDAQRFLDAALAVARRECMWHVTPVRDQDTLTLDGPGKSLLSLPTRKLLALDELSENGVAADVTKLTWSETGSVRKASGYCWSGKYRSISVKMTHGFTETEAADWRNAVLSMVDAMSQMPIPTTGGRSDNELTRKKVGEVEYMWSDGKLLELAEKAMYSVSSVIDWYRLIPEYFL